MWIFQVSFEESFQKLVGEFYTFVRIDSVGGINSDERIKFYVVMFVDGKLYRFKGKFYPTNGFVKVKYFFHWRDTYLLYDVQKWFRLTENCFTLIENRIPQMENNLPQTDMCGTRIQQTTLFSFKQITQMETFVTQNDTNVHLMKSVYITFNGLCWLRNSFPFVGSVCAIPFF